jgi:hypothetical protein
MQHNNEPAELMKTYRVYVGYGLEITDGDGNEVEAREGSLVSQNDSIGVLRKHYQESCGGGHGDPRYKVQKWCMVTFDYEIVPIVDGIISL